MTLHSHRVHGLAGDEIAPDWPPITSTELYALARRHALPTGGIRISWRSPRPLSAACLAEIGGSTRFIKRHHVSVRSVATLEEEHRFMIHLRARGVPMPAVIAAPDGHTAIALGDWVYEIHERAQGRDRFRQAISWSPLAQAQLARTAGSALARMHEAAQGFDAAQRGTHLLVARSELMTANDPVATLQAQLSARPGLADYLRDRPWQEDLTALFAPWRDGHALLAGQPRLWTHGDWHVSNLCWSSDDDDAKVTAVLDFGLSAANFAMFDLATAIERNAIAWLELDRGDGAVHLDIALALIAGYHAVHPLADHDLRALACLLPLVHVDFALSEVEYFHAVTYAHEAADVAYDTFLKGHAAWFTTSPGRRLLQAITGPA